MTSSHRIGVLLGGVLILALPNGALGDYTLLGGTGLGGSNDLMLVEIDPLSGATTPHGGSYFWTGLDFSPDEMVLYGVGTDLCQIDPSDGSQTVIGPLTYLDSEPILMRSMTISPAGEMYALSHSGSDPAGESRLYQVDLETGALDLVGTPSAAIYGIEFSPDGLLYGAFGDVFVIDPANASTQETLGGLGGPYVIELDFTPSGQLLGLERYDGSAGVFEIDLGGTSGSLASLMTSVPADEVRSIASAVPEPASLILITTAALILGRRRA
jgi:hypothetical protein